MEKKTRGKYLLVISAAAFASIVAIYFLPGVILNILMLLMHSSDSSSKKHEFFRNVSISIISRTSTSDKYLSKCIADDSGSPVGVCLQLAGLSGQVSLSSPIRRAVEKNIGGSGYPSSAYYAVKSLAMLGDQDNIPFLEELLKKDDAEIFPLKKHDIARMLFLLTGTKYEYKNASGKTVPVKIIDSLAFCREVVKKSHGRRRDYSEMMTLDYLFRPPRKNENGKYSFYNPSTHKYEQPNTESRGKPPVF